MKAVFVGGRYNGITMNVEDVIKIGNGKFTEDLTHVRNNGGWCHREELDNQPKVDGYAGPMWNGDGLRYETWEVYDMMSR